MDAGASSAQIMPDQISCDKVFTLYIQLTDELPALLKAHLGHVAMRVCSYTLNCLYVENLILMQYLACDAQSRPNLV